ncbi:hypothetical protein [Brasilonema bromeliae]|uniref:Uncharacterized protein n=1 Tax=Brasilonema bromeliae SPC951 TaxID=385972 RepID=A0ABX1P5W8_9CYAN|nr:hypothetical protein [Brasilonema bromeliae]NMG19346.1 hypothetical protein [Brasilonema bromeliae SPC951]
MIGLILGYELIRVVTQYLMLYSSSYGFGSIDADFSGDFDGGLGGAMLHQGAAQGAISGA